MLKTGVKDGANKGKSFYVCVEKQNCDFYQPARYLSWPSACISAVISFLGWNIYGNSHLIFSLKTINISFRLHKTNVTTLEGK